MLNKNKMMHEEHSGGNLKALESLHIGKK